jgi:hypothetical protein
LVLLRSERCQNEPSVGWGVSPIMVSSLSDAKTVVMSFCPPIYARTAISVPPVIRRRQLNSGEVATSPTISLKERPITLSLATFTNPVQLLTIEGLVSLPHCLLTYKGISPYGSSEKGKPYQLTHLWDPLGYCHGVS